MPDDETLRTFYVGFAFEKPAVEDAENDVPAIERSLRHFIGTPSARHDRFLDYGGGYGLYCKAARRLGWTPSLFDYDHGCLDYARDEMGVEKVSADLADFAGQQFDVIWGYHVIEHWNRIDENIAQLVGLLAPGGRIIFATPHAEGVEKWVRPYHLRNYARGLIQRGEPVGRAWRLALRRKSFFCWDPPRHLFAYTGESLRAMGRRHGLEARVETGYNTSAVYEPRCYVVPNPLAPRFKVPAGASGARSAARWVTAWFSWAGCRVLQRLFPRWGEQLYVTYTRAES